MYYLYMKTRLYTAVFLYLFLGYVKAGVMLE